MPTCIYPVISFDSVYQNADTIDRLFAPRNDSEPSDTIDVTSARKLFDYHSKEDNMFICLSKKQIGASTNDIIYATDQSYSETNSCFVRAFHTVTNDDAQIINVFRDSSENDSSICYYLYKKLSGDVYKLNVDKKSWRLDGWNSTPVKPMPANLGSIVKTKTINVPSYKSNAIELPIKTIKRKSRARANNTTYQLEQLNQELMSVNVDPKKFQYDRHIQVKLYYKKDDGTYTEFVSGTKLYTFVSSGNSIECRGVSDVTINGSGPVDIRIFSNTQFSETYFFGIGDTNASNNIEIEIYRDTLYNVYDDGDSFVIQRPNLNLDFSNFGSGDWIWWSDPLGGDTSRSSGFISDYFGTTNNAKWKIIKTQSQICYKIGSSIYGTPFPDMDNQSDTMFNIQFASTPSNKEIDFLSSGNYTYGIASVTIESGKYKWLPFHSLENSKLTIPQESYVRSQYNFEKVGSGDTSTFELGPGNGFKLYPTTTNYSGSGITIEQNTNDEFQSTYGVTVFKNIYANTWTSNSISENIRMYHGLQSNGVFNFQVSSGIISTVFTGSGINSITSRVDPVTTNWTFTATSDTPKRFRRTTNYVSSGSNSDPTPGSVSFAYNSGTYYKVYPLEVFIVSEPVITYTSSGNLGETTGSNFAKFAPNEVSFNIKTRAFILSSSGYLTSADSISTMNTQIHSALANMTLSSGNVSINNSLSSSVHYGDIVTFEEEETIKLNISSVTEELSVLGQTATYALTSGPGNFYFREEGDNLVLKATNTDLTLYLPSASQEVDVQIYEKPTVSGTATFTEAENSSDLIYDQNNWFFAVDNNDLKFVYEESLSDHRVVATWSLGDGDENTSLTNDDTIKYIGSDANNAIWRFGGKTDGTRDSSSTFGVIESRADSNSSWKVVARFDSGQIDDVGS